MAGDDRQMQADFRGSCPGRIPTGVRNTYCGSDFPAHNRDSQLSPKAELWQRSLRSARGARLSDMIVPASRTVAAAVLLVGLCLAQQEPVTPSFHAQTDLVTVPFQVRRGSRSVSDLKPADVVLLEDGVPRGFTIFEAPPVHLTLDLVVMFDVTNPRVTPPRKDLKGRAGIWDTQALRDLADYWSEAIARQLLDQHGASIRFSID